MDDRTVIIDAVTLRPVSDGTLLAWAADAYMEGQTSELAVTPADAVRVLTAIGAITTPVRAEEELTQRERMRDKYPRGES